MMLRQTFPDVPDPHDWHDYPSLHKIWAKCKMQIKKPNFLAQMKNFDIRSVRKQDIDRIRRMYYGDIWMSAEMVDRHKGIATESAFALAMWRWVNKIIEFIDVV